MFYVGYLTFKYIGLYRDMYTCRYIDIHNVQRMFEVIPYTYEVHTSRLTCRPKCTYIPLFISGIALRLPC